MGGLANRLGPYTLRVAFPGRHSTSVKHPVRRLEYRYIIVLVSESIDLT